MFSEAHATWKGGPYAGEGAVSTPSAVLNNATYAFGWLAGGERFTTPYELLAAAIASSMSTMVAVEMARLGIKPTGVDTHAALTLDSSADKWRITGAHLEITARTTGDAESDRFEQAVESARRECPISRVLNLQLTCKTKLISLAPAAFV